MFLVQTDQQGSSLLIFYSHSLQFNMFGISDKYEQLWRAIIRPPRAEYSVDDLGPKIFKRKHMKIERTDVQIVNKEGKKLQCSHFQPHIRPCRQLPCVIYLHANSSCRLEGARIVHYLASRDITVFTFDFAGCGLSEGEYISLGYYEKGDVDAIFRYLRELGTVSSIGIWGRSMGAVTALMYADSNHQIGCLVLDSPFSNLQRLSKELAQKYGGGLAVFSGIALSFVKSTIKDKHNFDIQDLDPIGKHVKKAFIPAFFIHGKDDDFIVPKHSEDLFAAYSGGENADKRIKIVEGDHNQDRGEQIYEQLATFFYYGLCVSQLVKEDKAYIQKQKQKLGLKDKQKKQNYKKVDPQFIDYSFGLQNQQEQMLRKAMLLSLSDSAPKQEKQQKKKEQKP